MQSGAIRCNQKPDEGGNHLSERRGATACSARAPPISESSSELSSESSSSQQWAAWPRCTRPHERRGAAARPRTPHYLMREAIRCTQLQSGAISSTAAHSALPASAAQCNGCAPSRLAPSVRCGARCSSLRRHVGQRAAQLRCAAVALSIFWTACAAAPARRRASMHSQSLPPVCACSAAMSSAGRPSPARWLMNAEAGCRWSRFESNKLMHPGLPCAAAAWSQLQFRAARPSGRSAGGGDAAKGGGPKALSSALGSSATSAMRASGGRRSHASGGSGREVGGGGLPRALKDIIRRCERKSFPSFSELESEGSRP